MRSPHSHRNSTATEAPLYEHPAASIGRNLHCSCHLPPLQLGKHLLCRWRHRPSTCLHLRIASRFCLHPGYGRFRFLLAFRIRKQKEEPVRKEQSVAAESVLSSLMQKGSLLLNENANALEALRLFAEKRDLWRTRAR